MGYILRTFHSRDPMAMLTLWKAIIIPHTDYCSQLWPPEHQGNLSKLDGLQRSFTPHITLPQSTQSEPTTPNYWERLKECQLYSVERRLERHLIIYAWKALEGHITPQNTEPIHLATQKPTLARNGRKCAQLHLPSACPARLNTLQHHTVSRKGTTLFTCLPTLIREVKGVKLEVFKRKLDKYLPSHTATLLPVLQPPPQ